MLVSRTRDLALRAAVLLASSILASLLAAPGGHTPPPANAGQGTVRLEWLGELFYRLTSPQGGVVLTSPWLENLDTVVQLDELVRTDLILVPNAHRDDLGDPIPVAAASGATVVAPAPLGRWLIDNGLEASQFRRAGIGDLFTLNNLRVKVGPSAHDNALPTGADGGPAASYFITFENGFTVFYNGHSSLIADLALYAAVYQPDLAILGVWNDPAEFAQVARLMATDNPKLRTVVAAHIRPGLSTADEARGALDQLGLGHLMFVPELRTAYEF
jgi:L-ascorbate metabolism protein UlaG (beta-lactamase superfamily)